MLREHQIDKYVARDGVYCPYCESTRLHDLEDDTWGEDATLERELRCEECNRHWKELYRLAEIREIK